MLQHMLQFDLFKKSVCSNGKQAVLEVQPYLVEWAHKCSIICMRVMVKVNLADN